MGRNRNPNTHKAKNRRAPPTLNMTNEDPKPEEEEPELSAMLDLGKKKKKKKRDKKEKSSSSATDKSKSSKHESMMEDQRMLLLKVDEEPSQIGGRPARPKIGLHYAELLDRVMLILHANNPDLIEKKRRNMKPPQLTRVGTKKTLWINFQEICTMMQRPAEHVFQFFMAELGTEGSIDGNQRLVIRGKYVPKYIESLLRKYIVEYVTCQMCRSPNTELTKDSVSRLHFCHCRDCGSSRSVAPIRSGYHATSRADRRAARNAKV